ncbi:hypothetical protein K450DRAFT_270657 [Umbelopsis ramanniana AG]|uniref:DUF4604 domain-containing protein n=1 Tax=Umbelopsis ramanniana AG TaxID=1314678 RepID=A0AAD5HE42_UMBRA|nr:uncharacterized protein K450DRAFT_270657 [Umbelopsis ramanniana AG]KAI8580877.1 hypothetical protein K450DRAFT_270657 [Umbelopsis ramanniana AG]
MPKDPTPYQLSKNLEYVQKEAPFLAKLKAKHQDPIKKKFEDWNPEDDDDEYDEFQGAQVVVLKEGKHYSEADLQRHLRGEEVDLSKSQEDDTTEASDDTKSVDENGKLMFRPKKKPVDGPSSSVTVGSKAMKRKHADGKLDGVETASTGDESKKKKKKEKKKKETKLSFDIDDE